MVLHEICIFLDVILGKALYFSSVRCRWRPRLLVVRLVRGKHRQSVNLGEPDCVKPCPLQTRVSTAPRARWQKGVRDPAVLS